MMLATNAEILWEKISFPLGKQKLNVLFQDDIYPCLLELSGCLMGIIVQSPS